MRPPNWQSWLLSTVVDVPTAANISAVANVPADVAARGTGTLLASALLFTLLMEMLLMPLAFFGSQLCFNLCC